MMSPRTAHSGSILLLVLIVIAMLTFASMALFDRMFAERRGAETHGRGMQTRALAESGVEYAKALLTQNEQAIADMGGLYNNPDRFRGALVLDSDVAALRGRFTLLAPALDVQGYYEGIRYGLEDESSRWNLSTLPLLDAYEENAGRKALMQLPDMTEQIADAILDFVDEDDEPRVLGAEAQYYTSLSTPYEPPNGPLESVEQLLLVRDVTPQMLFGADTNRNGILEAGEDAVARQSELPVTIGRGWSAYLTVHSAERNVRPDGTPKIDINSTDLNALHTELSGILDSEKANFIIAYRQGGPYEGEEEGNSAGSITVDFEQEGGTTIGSLLDLVGVKTQIPAENGGQGGQGGGQGGQGGGQGGQGGGQGGGGGAQPEVIAAAFPDDANSMQDYMPKLYDNLTVGTDPAVPGRVNINQAPRVVLQGLPGIEPLLVEQIISRRTPEKSPSMPAHNHPTWLVIEGLVELDEMKRLAPLLTCGGSVYRAECVGFYEAEGPAARLEVVLDGTKPVPAVRLRRDISELGPGQTLEILGGEVLAGEVESEP